MLARARTRRGRTAVGRAGKGFIERNTPGRALGRASKDGNERDAEQAQDRNLRVGFGILQMDHCADFLIWTDIITKGDLHVTRSGTAAGPTSSLVFRVAE